MKLTMRLGVRSYDIIIKQGGLSRVGQLINLNRRVLVVSDTGVPEAYLKTVLAQCREGVPVVLPQGEGTKSLECFGQLLTVMLEHGFTRGDAVLALGGGVVGTLRALPRPAICGALRSSTAPPRRFRRSIPPSAEKRPSTWRAPKTLWALFTSPALWWRTRTR